MKKILDACCGSRMFWFNKQNPDVLFQDIREETHTLCDGRHLEVKPDVVGDFRNMDYPDSSFKLVVFDPPHLSNLGNNSWMAKKYGVLQNTWQEDIRLGFKECFRVLELEGFLIFKWNENQIKVSEILSLSDYSPLLGHKSGKRQGTHWILFQKK